MRTAVVVLLHLAIAPLVLAANRISFERILPAAQDLGTAEDIAVVDADGDPAIADTFVETLIRHTSRSGVLRLRDARNTTGPAQMHLAVRSLQCASEVREVDGASRDVDGNRIRQRVMLVEAVCSARIDVLSKTMRPVSAYFVRGEGKSRKVDRITAEERSSAIEEAARFAAIQAAERISPRRVRESIQLAADAPDFAEGMALIDAGRIAEARALWEASMRRDPRNAALRFNLAAACEAAGDRRAAEQHYTAARQLAPAEPRYANELRLFARRGSVQ